MLSIAALHLSASFFWAAESFFPPVGPDLGVNGLLDLTFGSGFFETTLIVWTRSLPPVPCLSGFLSLFSAAAFSNLLIAMAMFPAFFQFLRARLLLSSSFGMFGCGNGELARSGTGELARDRSFASFFSLFSIHK